MLFTSFEFFVLLSITFTGFYLVKNQQVQTIILILSSFIFYAWHYPTMLSLLIISGAINTLISFQLENASQKASSKMLATIGVVVNLGILAFFKYSPLVGKTFFSDASSVGEFLIGIPLPIGISFFTFQSISLLVDVFKEKELKLIRNGPKRFGDHGLRVMLFITLFPQLIAGPVVKAYEFLPQIGVKKFREIDWDFCIKSLIVGYFLKMVIADNLKDHTFWMEYPYFESKPGVELCLMLFGYSNQIFADFAGYSLIAIGLAGLFGYRLRDNFMFPYISTSFSEFWTRWHISLSTFLKEYLYIPLGGNRKGSYRTYINLFLTMVLGGLWHGAAWSYAIWGAFHGAALAFERVLKHKIDIEIPSLVKMFWVFSVVTIGWLLFKLPEFNHVIAYVQTLFSNKFLRLSEGSLSNLFLISAYSLPIILYHSYYLHQKRFDASVLNKMKPVLLGIMLFLILTNSGSSGDFIYFQF